MLSWLWLFTIPWVPVVQPVPEVWGWEVDRWQPLVEEALEDYGLESEVDAFMRVLHCESRGDPYAVNPTSGTSGPDIGGWKHWECY